MDIVLATIVHSGGTASHLPNHTMTRLARNEMVPAGLIGNHQVAVLTPQVVDLIVDSLHTKAILQGDTNRLLLFQTQDRGGVVRVRGSRVNMAEDMKSLQVAIVGVYLLDPPPLGGSLHRTTVEGQGTLPTLRPPV